MNRSWRGVLDTTQYDTVCPSFAIQPIGRWFSPSTPVSSTNETEHHDMNEILLKVALNTIPPNQSKHCPGLVQALQQ